MTEKKKRVNSKQKGSEYERKIAKILSKYWGEDFHRTPMSGGLHWKDDNRVAGDIVTPPTSIYPWTTECKKRQEWGFDQLLKGTGEVEQWWKQALGDSVRVGLKPLVIFAKNFSPNYMMFEYEDAKVFAKELGMEELPFIHFVLHKPNTASRVICILEDFIKHVPKEVVIKALDLEK